VEQGSETTPFAVRAEAVHVVEEASELFRLPDDGLGAAAAEAEVNLVTGTHREKLGTDGMAKCRAERRIGPLAGGGGKTRVQHAQPSERLLDVGGAKVSQADPTDQGNQPVQVEAVRQLGGASKRHFMLLSAPDPPLL
jgi:hypothetical protein